MYVTRCHHCCHQVMCSLAHDLAKVNVCSLFTLYTAVPLFVNIGFIHAKKKNTRALASSRCPNLFSYIISTAKEFCHVTLLDHLVLAISFIKKFYLISLIHIRVNYFTGWSKKSSTLDKVNVIKLNTHLSHDISIYTPHNYIAWQCFHTISYYLNYRYSQKMHPTALFIIC